MQYIDKHLIIERYTNGSMSPKEVQDFHAMLETDGELRSMFRAENILNSAISRNRTALEAADHSRMYASFLKSLANSVPQAAAATAPTGSTGLMGWLSGLSTSAKLTLSAITVTGAVTLGIALYPSSSDSSALPESRTPATVHPVASPVPARSVEAAPASNSSGSAQAVVKPSKTTTPTEEKAATTVNNAVQKKDKNSSADDIPLIDNSSVKMNVKTE